MSNTRRKPSRLGFTLVECMTTLSLLAVLGVAASTLLSKVTQIGLETNHNKSSRQMVLRMSRTFRADVATADTATIENESSFVLQSPDQTVTYSVSVSPPAIHRVVESKNNPVSRDNPISRERYALPSRCRPQLSESNETFRLDLTRPDASNPWTIEAVKP